MPKPIYKYTEKDLLDIENKITDQLFLKRKIEKYIHRKTYYSKLIKLIGNCYRYYDSNINTVIYIKITDVSKSTLYVLGYAVRKYQSYKKQSSFSLEDVSWYKGKLDSKYKKITHEKYEEAVSKNLRKILSNVSSSGKK